MSEQDETHCGKYRRRADIKEKAEAKIQFLEASNEHLLNVVPGSFDQDINNVK